MNHSTDGLAAEAAAATDSSAQRAEGRGGGDALRLEERTHLNSGKPEVTADVDAPPSNRASIKCKEDIFIPLLQGIDSIEFSLPGRTSATIEADLLERKKLAQDRDPRKQAQAQIELADQLFEVNDKGNPRYPYVIRNPRFQIKILAASSSSLPFIYAQVRNEYLWHTGPIAVQKELVEIAAAIGQVEGEETISRVDLFVDFRTSANIEGIDRTHWITRASYKQSHSVDDVFTGWSVGLGSPTQGRLYNKPVEIERVSKKTYLYDLWGKGEYLPGDLVWRLEFQLRREVLKSLQITNLQSVLEAQPGLWLYLTTNFLRLAQPSLSDGTRSRWSNHPLWDAISALKWIGAVSELSRHYQPAGVPSDKWLARAGSSVLASMMAKNAIVDVRKGIDLLVQEIEKYWDKRAEFEFIGGKALLLERVFLKGRQFGTMNNIVPNDDASLAYRRASRG